MSKLEGERISDPIGNDLRPALSQERVDRMWRDISAARVGDGSSQAMPRRLRSPVVALAAAACVMIGGIALVRTLGDESASVTALTRVDGSALDAIIPAAEPARVPLSDGSELWVDKGAVLAPLDVSERAVVLHLVHGRARFAVKPHGPRRWVIEAGAASVEVVGTRFSVDRTADGVAVQVDEGKVLVRGASLPDGLVRLGAGEQVRVPAKPQPVEIEEAPESPAQRIEVESVAPEAPAEPERKPVPAPAPKVAPAPPLPAEVVQPAPVDAAALFAIADEARITRDYPRAIEALERVVREHGSDPRARLAAFTIGRIRDEQLRDLPGARAAYEKALALGLTGSLAEDCYGRLLRVLELQARDGLVSRAHLAQIAEQYVRRYPKGRYAAEARRLLSAKAP